MRPVIFGCEGLWLTAQEQHFFAEYDPAGFILFARNCDNPDQIRALIEDMRKAVGRDTLPILIDQEGGRVARLGPPHWHKPPAAKLFRDIYQANPEAAGRACYLNSLMIAADLTGLGITVDCLPVLDIPAEGADPIIGDRAYGIDPETVTVLARQAMNGLTDGGILPVIKHIPGHGRAMVDSHMAMPETDAAYDILSEWDFIPFRALADAPFAMTAHMLYASIDSENCATFSRTIIRDIIRKDIGFSGLLMSDDLSMGALGGRFGERTRKAIGAGCDLVLHCNGVIEEMVDIVAALKSDARLEEKLANTMATVASPAEIDRRAVEEEYNTLTAGQS